jgi:hypothetical protein
LESVIQTDLTEYILKCSGKPEHLVLHGIDPLARPTRFFSHSVEGGHLGLQHGDPLLLLELFECPF